MQATICCLLINHEHKLDFGCFANVAVSANIDVYDLTEMIKVKRLTNLAHVDADRLEVWKPNGPVEYKRKTIDQTNETIKRIEFSENSDAAELLDSAQNVTSLDLPKDSPLLVRVPPPPPQIPGITLVLFH
jgi:hypothetical protein